MILGILNYIYWIVNLLLAPVIITLRVLNSNFTYILISCIYT